jgi:hypothetical protein
MNGTEYVIIKQTEIWQCTYSHITYCICRDHSTNESQEELKGDFTSEPRRTI